MQDTQSPLQIAFNISHVLPT